MTLLVSGAVGLRAAAAAAAAAAGRALAPAASAVPTLLHHTPNPSQHQHQHAQPPLQRHADAAQTPSQRPPSGHRGICGGAGAAYAPQYGGYLGTGTAAPVAHGDTATETRVLVTGACGQIGAELVPYLRARLGTENVIASDVKTNPGMLRDGPFMYLDVQDKDNLTRVVLENGVNCVAHLATLLSAVGERNPQLALRINTTGIQNVLDIAANHGLKVFSPSTIAVFGDTSPREMTPDNTVMQPKTMYGVTKVHQELLGSYYRERFNVDYRSLRYPGIISSKAAPGGGTTDYAVEIFHAALSQPRAYTCFLEADAKLPMMYMPDCLEATWKLMMAPPEQLTRATYNVTAMTFSPEELAAAITRVVPGFSVTYTPDFRNDIASTWPDSVDDRAARHDWGWQHRYDLTVRPLTHACIHRPCVHAIIHACVQTSLSPLCLSIHVFIIHAFIRKNIH